MRVLAIDPDRPQAELLEEAAAVLRGGGLVAFPTETVYGLGANALDAAAVRRIYAAKGRPAFNPLIAHVHGLGAARRLAARWPDAAEHLARAFWPGPLTLVLPRRAGIPDEVTAGRDTVGVRVPAHPVALALLERVALPLAAPSANRYTQVSPTTAQHVANGLAGRVELILDGGATRVGIESTVLDVTDEAPVLLRPGSIPLPELEAVVGPIRRSGEVAGDAPRPAPGMVARHYSPRAELRLFPPDRREEMAALAATASAAGRRVGALLLEDLPARVELPVRMPDGAEGYARELYAALHRLDDAGCDLVLVDAVPDAPEWAGVRDRLDRARRRD
jgi:L-threonylcarbamoyladenylate synthase